MVGSVKVERTKKPHPCAGRRGGAALAKVSSPLSSDSTLFYDKHPLEKSKGPVPGFSTSVEEGLPAVEVMNADGFSHDRSRCRIRLAEDEDEQGRDLFRGEELLRNSLHTRYPALPRRLSPSRAWPARNRREHPQGREFAELDDPTPLPTPWLARVRSQAVGLRMRSRHVLIRPMIGDASCKQAISKTSWAIVPSLQGGFVGLDRHGCALFG